MVNTGRTTQIKGETSDQEEREAAATTSETESRSWAQVVNPVAMAELTVSDAESQLCPFGVVGECRYGENCAYIHGVLCDLCGRAALHPGHERQQKEHMKV